MPDAGQIVDEAYRVLKPGGAVHAMVRFCDPHHAFPADYPCFSRERLRELFTDFDATEIDIRSGSVTTSLTFVTYHSKVLFPVRHANRIRNGRAGS